MREKGLILWETDTCQPAHLRRRAEHGFGELNGGLRGGTQGAEPGSGVERFWGPLGASGFVSAIRDLGSPPSQEPLKPQKSFQGTRGGSSRASERCVRFQRSGKRRWGTQKPLRGPVFPDTP